MTVIMQKIMQEIGKFKQKQIPYQVVQKNMSFMREETNSFY